MGSFLRRPRGLGWMWWFGYAHEDFVGVGGVRRYKEEDKFSDIQIAFVLAKRRIGLRQLVTLNIWHPWNNSPAYDDQQSDIFFTSTSIKRLLFYVPLISSKFYKLSSRKKIRALERREDQLLH